MPTTHTVKQGEYLLRIAAQYGFSDYRPIWKHENNKELVKLRKSPNILLPGDRLFIPDKQVKTDNVATGSVYNYRLTVPVLKLRLLLKDFDNEPMANLDCEMEVEGTVHKVKSNAQGLIEHEIPRTAENGKLRIPSLEMEVPLKIGHLNPLDTDSGFKSRLMNLGYFEGGDDPLRLRYAIEEFQLDHNVKVTGELDDATRAKLKDAHGC
jgi:hypothetical protein